jgi:hypothetical protein
VIDGTVQQQSIVAGLALVGLVGGLVLLARGLGGFRAAGRVSGTSVSRIASLAVGEVLISGIAEPIEVTLISPLQSAPCVQYRSRIADARDGEGRELFREERAVGFRVRDASGVIRVFPNGARFDVPDRYDETTSVFGGDPTGFQPRTGSAFAPGPGDRDAQIAALLTVPDERGASLLDRNGLAIALSSSGRREFHEARIEPGDPVTIIGRALPFRDLADPAGANYVDGSGVGADDPEIAADLAPARAAGLLEDTAADAWGNAAIEGFGIGRPVRTPELDPTANRPPPPDPAILARAAAAFEIAPDVLVLASSDEVPLRIALGAPAAVVARGDWQFVVGLVGAALAIGSAMALGLVVQGGLR